MSYKKTSLFFLSAFAVLGVYFYIVAMSFPAGSGTGIAASGPSFYPQLLSALMVVFSLGGIVSTLRKRREDKLLEIPYFKRFLLVLGLICVWIIVWDKFGCFYLISFICNGILLYVFNNAPNTLKKLRNTLLIDAIIMAVFYLIFKVLMQVPL
jgi:hypothetical protein